MLEQALGTETGRAADLIRAMSHFVQDKIEADDPRKIFLSGNSAATIHLKRCADLAVGDVLQLDETGKFFPKKTPRAAFSQDPIGEQMFRDLMAYLQKELAHFVSFGVQDRAVFAQLMDTLIEGTSIGNGFFVRRTSYSPNTYEDTDLVTDVFKIRLENEGENFDVKVYASATFRFPAIDSVHETTFNCVKLETFSRSFPVEGETDVFVMSLPDLLLLKHFSTLAPVTDRVRTHNAQIVQVLVSLIDDEETKAYVLNCFDTLLSHVRPQKRDNGRFAKLRDIGFDDDVIQRLNAGYDVVGELLSARNGRRNVYHNIWHTDSVLGQVINLFKAYFQDYDYKEELCFAALFHDCNLGLTEDTYAVTLGLLSRQHGLNLDKQRIQTWIDRAVSAPDTEEGAAEIAALYLQHAFAWDADRTERVKAFIRATKLGFRVDVPEDPESDDYTVALGQALLQTADIYQTMIGDFHLFLANNRQLIVELGVNEAEKWYQDTLDMLDQLWHSVSEAKTDNPQFNVHILQFSFPGKDRLVEKLKWGIEQNRKRWLEQGLARCKEWAESI